MEKIKQFVESDKGKDILIVIIVILVGLGCFELGRLSKENSNSGIKILNQGASAILSAQAGLSENSLPVNSSIGKTFFASSKGSKYYTISCSAGKTIKKENRVYFATGEEAQAAGYKLSSSCN